MVNGFKQAQTNIGQTKMLAEQAEVSRLGIVEGTSLIGDSVALRANTALKEALPDANINAQVSRTTKQANDIMLNNSQNKALLKTVVIATVLLILRVTRMIWTVLLIICQKVII